MSVVMLDICYDLKEVWLITSHKGDISVCGRGKNYNTPLSEQLLFIPPEKVKSNR